MLHPVAADDPTGMFAGYRRAPAPGSYLVLTHASADHRPTEARTLQGTFNRGYGPGTSMTLRSEAEVRAMFDGFELVPPGLVQLTQWRPDDPGDVGEHPERLSTYAGVGRLP